MSVFPIIEACPSCGSKDRLGFGSVPASVLTYKRRGELHTDHMPPMREYHCRDCSTKFLLMPEGTR